MLHIVVYKNILDTICNKKCLNIRLLLKSYAKDLRFFPSWKDRGLLFGAISVSMQGIFKAKLVINFAQIFVYLLFGCFHSKLYRFLICAVVHCVKKFCYILYYCSCGCVADILQTIENNKIHVVHIHAFLDV